MLHANFDTAFTDSSLSAHGDATVYEQAQIDTAQSKFGGASGLFDGNGDWISFPDNDDWTFGTEPFTIDFWGRNLSGGVVTQLQNVGNWWGINFRSANTITYFQAQNAGGWTLNFQFTYTYPADTWYHIAIVRTSTAGYCFVNGEAQAVQLNLGAWGNNLANVGAVLKMGQENNNVWLGGNIDEFRISKGIARWTEDFSASLPTEEYSEEVVPPTPTTNYLKFYRRSRFPGAITGI
jgi:hypothetical protein